MYQPPKFHHGVDIGEACELADIGGGVAGLPAVDASLLTGLSSGPVAPNGYVSIGSSGDYARVQLALASGETKMALLEAVTETTSITGSGGFPAGDIKLITGPYDWTFAANIEFEDTGYDDRFDVIMNDGEFVWANTSANTQVFRCSEGTSSSEANGKFVFKGVGTFRNNSTQTQCGIIAVSSAINGEGTFKAILPDKYESFIVGFGKGAMNWGSLELVGGGTSCYEGLELQSDGAFNCDKLILSGTWSTSQDAIKTTDVHCDVRTLQLLTNCDVQLGGRTHSITRSSNQATGTLQLFDDAKIMSGDLMGFDEVALDNDTAISHCDMTFEDITTVGTLRRVNISHCHGWNPLADDWVVDTQHSQYAFNRNMLTLTCSGDDNILIGNAVGHNTGGGGGAGTITTSGDYNVCIGNQTDAAIVDSGTGNSVANNIVY